MLIPLIKTVLNDGKVDTAEFDCQIFVPACATPVVGFISVQSVIVENPEIIGGAPTSYVPKTIGFANVPFLFAIIEPNQLCPHLKSMLSPANNDEKIPLIFVIDLHAASVAVPVFVSLPDTAST